MGGLRFFDKYYAKLGLAPDSNDAEIKSAYRRLAKIYHPDRSGNPETRDQFIAVNEAYEILLKRELYIRDAIRRYKNKAKNHKSESRQRDMGREARFRAARHADMPFDKFAKSPIYRTAVVVNSVFDYVAVIAGLVMIVAPMVSYFEDMTRLLPKGEEPDFHAVPIFIGFCFLYGVWYFQKKIE
ncbi:MAG: J domain-containing protein [Cryomorphaceae bacterium]